MPDYGGACLDSLGPALLAPPGARPAWLPVPLQEARQVVLLVFDGLGWLQLKERARSAPSLSALDGRPITSVAPTTTATALTSLSVGTAPAGHGILGYKFSVVGPAGKEVMNTLRWSTPSGDARRFFSPVLAQPTTPFAGREVPLVSRSDFLGSGFSEAHQRGARFTPWVVPSSVVPLVTNLLAEGEPFIYAYYDGVDRVAHATGLGELYEAELRYADTMVRELVQSLPEGAALAVTADHGQVEVGAAAEVIDAEVASVCALVSGEARFRWLHAAPGQAERLAELALRRYGGEAWVAPRQEVLGSGIFGGVPAPEAAARLGDVVLVPLGNGAYMDPADREEARLVCRHGGLSPAEVLVPLLCAAP